MGIKAAFFDLDDTLYCGFQKGDAYAYEQVAAYAEKTFGIPGQTFTDAFRASRKLLARRQPGLPPIHDRILSAQMTLESLGLNAIRYAKEIHRVYWESLFSKMELRAGVPQFLDELHSRGVQTAICTDMFAAVQMRKLETLGLADRIDFMVSSEEAGMDKPGAPIFLLALHKCGVLPSEAVMVGDNFRHDVQGAADVGIQGIWLNWTGLPRPEVDFSYLEASTFEEAAEHIRGMLSGGNADAAL